MTRVVVKLISSAARSLLQPGRCFAVLATCRSMRHGRRLHCAAQAYRRRFRFGFPEANRATVGRAASSGHRPSLKPFRLFDEKRAALPFFLRSSRLSSPLSCPLSFPFFAAVSPRHPGGAA